MAYKRAWEQEEAAAGLTPTQKTATELKKIYESVYTELKFEMETAEDFESQTLPTLDFQCWMESGKLLYKFFRKPMSKQTLIMKESALSENIKITSLTQEVIRLSKNTSENVPLETRVAIIDDFQHRLELSGYSLQASRRILVSGLQGYERIKRLAAKTGGYINRPARVGEEGRRLKKLLGKSNWFKKKRKKQQEEGPNQRERKKNNVQKDKSPPRVTSVLFAPKARHSELRGGSRAVRSNSLCLELVS